MKTELEAKSSQLLDDAGSKNYQYSNFFPSMLAFLHSASMILKGNRTKKRKKRKTYFVDMLFRKTKNY